MIDIHSHLIFDVDDGAYAYKESLRMALEAEQLGFDIIVATPHYSNKNFPERKLLKNFNKLKTALMGCDIEIQLGYEVLINDMHYEGAKERRDLTLGDTKYMLFELPFNLMPSFAESKLIELHNDHIIPIIAHPERYPYFNKNIDSFVYFIEKGCMVQLDAGSILGAHGHEAKDFAKKIIKLGLVDFVASDAHCTEDYISWFPASYEQVIKWVGHEYADELFHYNPLAILQ